MAGDKQSLKVLIVDSDPEVPRVFGGILDNSGHQLSASGNTESAWKVLERDQHDIVVIGSGVPVTAGLELSARMRERRELDSTVILMLLERIAKETLSLALAAGIDDCLLWPAQPADLRIRLAFAESLAVAKRRNLRQEETQTVLFEISEATGASSNLLDLLALIHAGLGQLIDQKNFYVALRAEGEAIYDLPFCVDEIDESIYFCINPCIFTRKKGSILCAVTT